MRARVFGTVVCLLLLHSIADAEVVKVTITSRGAVANGQSFGAVGPYEKLAGTIEFALDPRDPHNARVAGLDRATPAADGKVHFTSDLYVLRPATTGRGNGVLLFEIANRGRKDLLARFNGGRASNDPIDSESIGDGFLMRDGYTLVWVGWEFDLPPGGVRLEAPPATVDPMRTLTVSYRGDAASPTATFADAYPYPPAQLDDAQATLTVRDTFWDAPQPIARGRWHFVKGENAPAVALEGGFAAGRIYDLTYHPATAFVAGAGLAAIRDAASAFRTRTDLPVAGRSAYVFGMSQSGRFLRQFLYDGFNADGQDRRVFDAVWAHVAGAARGSFNDTLAMPRSFQGFLATKRPFADEPVDGLREGVESRYRDNQRPKIFYTNSPDEYWGGGRAAAMIHTSVDGRKDLSIPGNVRIYFYAGVQHAGAAPIPPPHRRELQSISNPTPQFTTSRALLRALDAWARLGTAPPASQYPRVSDGTLVDTSHLRFPAIPGVPDPRHAPAPGIASSGGNTPLRFLVPQVDADGNEVSGIRVPDQAVPLATVTGWNFRSQEVGVPRDLFDDGGAYVPFASTRSAREAAGDPRRSIEERYPSRASYLQRVRTAAEELVKKRFLLQEDVAWTLQFAERHWDYATRAAAASSR